MEARARTTDPQSSHLAAADVEKTGTARTQRQVCLQEVIQNPGQTSAEIAAGLDLERYTPSRRLPELRDAGLVFNGPDRVCKVRGRISLTWYPVHTVRGDEI